MKLNLVVIMHHRGQVSGQIVTERDWGSEMKNVSGPVQEYIITIRKPLREGATVHDHPQDEAFLPP